MLRGKGCQNQGPPMGHRGFPELPEPSGGDNKMKPLSADPPLPPFSFWLVRVGAQEAALVSISLGLGLIPLPLKLTLHMMPPPSSALLPSSFSSSSIPQHRQHSLLTALTPAFYFRFSFHIFRPKSIPRAGTGSCFSHKQPQPLPKQSTLMAFLTLSLIGEMAGSTSLGCGKDLMR